MQTFLPDYKIRYAQRHHHPLDLPDDHLRASLLLRPHTTGHRCALSDETFLMGDRGRRRFTPTSSQEFVFRAHRRMLAPPCPPPSEKRGKRRCDAAMQRSSVSTVDTLPIIPQKRRGDKYGASKETEADVEFGRLPSHDWMRKKAVPDSNEEGQNKLFNLEKAMTRKKRVTTATIQRNGPSQVDNAYKKSENVPGFFYEPGLIPGSFVSKHPSSKAQLAQRSQSSSVNIKSVEATYGKFKLKEAREYDIEQVKSLTMKSTRNKAEYPSWEQRTGCFLVSPEDEAF